MSAMRCDTVPRWLGLTFGAVSCADDAANRDERRQPPTQHARHSNLSALRQLRPGLKPGLTPGVRSIGLGAGGLTRALYER